MASKFSGLGRGLDSLFADNDMMGEETGTKGLVTVRVAMIEPKSDQPRKTFDDNSLAQLAASISTHGLLQPILVRPLPNDRYQIVAGERRWRACKMAGIAEVPVIVMDEDEMVAAEISLIENIQREDLNPLEEAMAYQALIDAFGFTQEKLAERVGKSRPAVANALRLLDLPEELMELVKNGTLSAGHARTLLGCKNKAVMIRLGREVANGGMSVRDLEKAVKKANRPEKPEKEEPFRVDYAQDLSNRMTSQLGRRVVISDKGSKKSVTLYYQDNEDLEVLLTQICGAEFLDEI